MIVGQFYQSTYMYVWWQEADNMTWLTVLVAVILALEGTFAFHFHFDHGKHDLKFMRQHLLKKFKVGHWITSCVRTIWFLSRFSSYFFTKICLISQIILTPFFPAEEWRGVQRANKQHVYSVSEKGNIVWNPLSRLSPARFRWACDHLFLSRGSGNRLRVPPHSPQQGSRVKWDYLRGEISPGLTTNHTIANSPETKSQPWRIVLVKVKNSTPPYSKNGMGLKFYEPKPCTFLLYTWIPWFSIKISHCRKKRKPNFFAIGPVVFASRNQTYATELKKWTIVATNLFLPIFIAFVHSFTFVYSFATSRMLFIWTKAGSIAYEWAGKTAAVLARRCWSKTWLSLQTRFISLEIFMWPRQCPFGMIWRHQSRWV
jgi:hypothetical protein